VELNLAELYKSQGKYAEAGEGALYPVAAGEGNSSSERDNMKPFNESEGHDVVCVRLPECGTLASDLSSPPERLPLTPYDVMNSGRAVPMIWFYESTIDIDALIEALRETVSSYPTLCGRYADPPWTAIELNNAGLPVYIDKRYEGATLAEAIAHIPADTSESESANDDYGLTPPPCYFARDARDAFLPPRDGMEPDTCSPCSALAKIKITTFLTGGGGTAVGILVMHSVMDADAIFAFMRNWSRAFRKLPLDDPVPVNDRGFMDAIAPGEVVDYKDDADSGDGDGKATLEPAPENFKVQVPAAGAPPAPPAFAGVMPKIAGPSVCAVALTKSILKRFKADAASSGDVPAGSFVSTDDLVTARAWRALCRMRCAQLGLALDDAELVTTCSRAVNFRKRASPPLPPGYSGNGVCQVWTEAKVSELVASSVPLVASWLRASLSANTAEDVAQRTRWLRRAQRRAPSSKPTLQFDANALTFILSSWGFDWQGAEFGEGVKAARFDHTAHVPIVSVIVPRPGGDGVTVYASGPQASLEEFARLLVQ